MTGAEAVFPGTDLQSRSVGIWSEDGRIDVRSCALAMMSNNGIAVWRDTITGDSSTITGNLINGIETVDGRLESMTAHEISSLPGIWFVVRRWVSVSRTMRCRRAGDPW